MKHEIVQWIFIVCGVLLVGAATIGVLKAVGTSRLRAIPMPTLDMLLGAHKYTVSPLLVAIAIFAAAWLIAEAWPDFTVKYRLQGGPSVWKVLAVFGIAAMVGLFVKPRGLGAAVAAGIVTILLVWIMVSTAITWIHGDDKSRGEDRAKAERVLAEQQQQAAIAAATRQNTASGFMPALGRMVVEYRPECVRTVIESYPFQSEYAPFPGGRCSTTFTYPAGTCVMYKANEDGPEEGPYGDCQGSKTPAIPADPKFARSIGAPFSVKLIVDQPVTVRTFQQ